MLLGVCACGYAFSHYIIVECDYQLHHEVYPPNYVCRSNAGYFFWHLEVLAEMAKFT